MSDKHIQLRLLEEYDGLIASILELISNSDLNVIEVLGVLHYIEAHILSAHFDEEN